MVPCKRSNKRKFATTPLNKTKCFCKTVQWQLLKVCFIQSDVTLKLTYFYDIVKISTGTISSQLLLPELYTALFNKNMVIHLLLIHNSTRFH